MEKINMRFTKLRKSLEISQETMGNILGITRSGVSNIESGFRKVTPKHIKMLCVSPIKGKYVNEKWLLTGNGEMYLDLPPEDEVASAISNVLEDIECENSIYTLVKELLLKYEQLDSNSKKVIDSYVNSVMTNYIEKKEKGEEQ